MLFNEDKFERFAMQAEAASQGSAEEPARWFVDVDEIGKALQMAPHECRFLASHMQQEGWVELHYPDKLAGPKLASHSMDFVQSNGSAGGAGLTAIGAAPLREESQRLLLLSLSKPLSIYSGPASDSNYPPGPQRRAIPLRPRPAGLDVRTEVTAGAVVLTKEQA